MATIAESAPAAPREPSASTSTGIVTVRHLVISHVWVAIAAFAVSCILGVWQMWRAVR